MNGKQQPIKRTRCAVYTRKSTEEGLDQEFNSLDAQREAGEAYVASQRHEGWTLVPDYYDDGGFSGGSMERPALKRLMRDIETGKIDVVVVYKVDRLSRSLADFAKIVDVFERQNVSFVSVTQQFNTTTSMGRLTLNILLSFAQFEREVIGERIRDKVAASKRKGMWMGGSPPYGYDVIERRLVINEAEAAVVRKIFQRFLVLRSTTKLTEELRQDGCLTKSYVTGSGRHKQGRLMDKGFLYKLLSNPVYLGEIRHRDQVYPGQHTAIIERAQWLDVRRIMEENPTARGNAARAQNPALLRGLIRCGGCDSGMTPTHTRRHGRQYRYYIGAFIAIFAALLMYIELKSHDTRIGKRFGTIAVLMLVIIGFMGTGRHLYREAAIAPHRALVQQKTLDYQKAVDDAAKNQKPDAQP